MGGLRRVRYTQPLLRCAQQSPNTETSLEVHHHDGSGRRPRRRPFVYRRQRKRGDHRDAVKLINPKAEVKSISDFGMPGVKQVVADTSVVYISDDGRFVFSGLMLDMVEKRNLSEEAQSLSRQALLSTIPKMP